METTISLTEAVHLRRRGDDSTETEIVDLQFPDTCKLLMRNSGNSYIIYDQMDKQKIIKILFLSRQTRKTGMEHKLDADATHPARIETMMTEKVYQECSDYTPHIVKLYRNIRINNIQKITFNDKPIAWNIYEYYPMMTILVMERGYCTLHEYLNSDISYEEFVDIVFQIFCTIYVIRQKISGFVHGDLISENVIMFLNSDYNRSEKFYRYTYVDKTYHIPVRQYIPKIIDYEFASSDSDKNALLQCNTFGVKNDIYRFLLSLRYNIYTIPETGIPNAIHYSSVKLPTEVSLLHYNMQMKDITRRDKINLKYERFFMQFPFLSGSIVSVFMNSSVSVPLLQEVIDTIIQTTEIDDERVVDYYPKFTQIDKKLEHFHTNIRLLILDFDQTLTNIFTYKTPTESIKNGSIFQKEIYEIFNNYIELRYFFTYITRRFNIKIAIVSFGNKSKIIDILRGLFHNIINEDDITGTDMIIPCDKITGGKNTQIAQIYEKYMIDPCHVMFFDDLGNITEHARKLQINCCNNKNTGITTDLLIDELCKY